MKKTMVLLMMIALVSTLGTAFAADTAAALDRSAGLYNGITSFDLGPASTGGEFVAPLMREAATVPYNGITVFELAQTGTSKRDYAARGSAAGGPAPELKLYNGITVF